MYPGNKDEVDKFVAGIITSLHSDKTRPGIMKQLTSQNVPVAGRLGNVTAQVISAMLVRVKQQAKRRPHKNLLLKSIHMTVKEVSKMAEMAGVKVTPEDRKKAARFAGNVIEDGHSGKAGQQQQAQQAGPAQPQMQQGQPQSQPGLLEEGGM